MKVAGVFIAGVLLGVLVMYLCHRSKTVYAQQVDANNQLRIHVSEVSKKNDVTPKGSRVVGFSCIDAYGRSADNFRCFIATAD